MTAVHAARLAAATAAREATVARPVRVPMVEGRSAPDAYGVDTSQVDERMHVLAIRCGVTLDPEDDPVTFGDVRRAASDDCALRAAVVHASKVLPEALATYLARSWQMHADAFDRVCRLSELEIAARWARQHAVAARSVLEMRPPHSGPEA